jgi:hypothetical protein
MFGYLAYIHMQSAKRSKLDPKSRKCIFLGLQTDVKHYMLWDPILKKKIVSRDAVFDEAYLLRKSEDETSTVIARK